MYLFKRQIYIIMIYRNPYKIYSKYITFTYRLKKVNLSFKPVFSLLKTLVKKQFLLVAP